MATPSVPDSPAVVQFAQTTDSLGRLFLIPRATAAAIFSGQAETVTITLCNPNAAQSLSTVTVSEAAAQLMQDNPGMDYKTATGITSRACREGKIRSTGEGTDRRIDVDSLAAWRLSRRDKTLDDAE